MSIKVTEARLIASICRDSLLHFVEEFWDTVVVRPLVMNWHIEVLCRELEELAVRAINNEPLKYDLIVNVPTGSSKSTICSILFPAWVWTRLPSAQVIGASYADPLALELCRKNRMVVASDKYRACFPEVKLSDDQNAKGHFATTAGGMRYSVGSGGSVQGLHGLITVIDDPIDPSRAVSEQELHNVNEWIGSTLSGRKVEKSISATILVMQRLHVEDPTAMFLQRKDVRHIRIPASTEGEIHPPELRKFYKPDPANPKYPYLLMDVRRLPSSVLERERGPGVLGELGYACQYLQSPVPVGGSMFKVDMLKWGTPPGAYKKIVRFWDKAGTVLKAKNRGRKPAWTVGILMAQDHVDRLWVLHVHRVRLDAFERERLIKRTAHRDGKRVVVGIEQEPGSGGKESAQNTVKRLMGFRVRVIRQDTDKATRAEEFAVQLNAGAVYLPAALRVGNSWTGWARELVDELKHWPFSTFKDQGDCASSAFVLICEDDVYVGAMPETTPDPGRRPYDVVLAADDPVFLRQGLDY